MKFLLMFFIIILNASLIIAKNPGSFRSNEIQGFGFGIESPGYVLFYDFSPKHLKFELFNNNFRFHSYYSSGSTINYDSTGKTFIDTNYALVGLTIRYFPSDEWGFYFGGGGGFHRVYQMVGQSIFCDSNYKSSNPTECTDYEGSDIKKTTESSYTGLGLYGVAGWQGYEGYYFTIGLKLGTSLKSSVNDKTHSVIDYSNHKSIAINDFNNGKNISGGELLFGWIF